VSTSDGYRRDTWVRYRESWVSGTDTGRVPDTGTGENTLDRYRREFLRQVQARATDAGMGGSSFIGIGESLGQVPARGPDTGAGGSFFGQVYWREESGHVLSRVL
jgi:hypothetical protein